MMMEMLARGGIELLVDDVRQADDSNPRGYFEYEPVKGLKDGDISWLHGARGKAVKVVSPLLSHLPDGYLFKVIFMTRSIDEILASQSRMLQRTGGDAQDHSQVDLRDVYLRHVKWIHAWLSGRSNIEVLNLRYDDVLDDPDSTVYRLQEFLGRRLSGGSMVTVVDPGLHRERAGGS